MNRLSSSIIRIYTQLLRLYPAQFQNEFAQEMKNVFEQSLHGSNQKLGLLALFLVEMRDLPFNVMREHVRARRNNALNPDMEVILMSPFQSPSLFRSSVIISLVMFSLYCLIVIRPVLALNLDTEAVQAVHNRELNLYYYIAEGFFQYRPVAPEDVGTLKSFMQRDTIHALVEALVAKSMLVSAPIGAIFLGGILIFSLVKNWSSMRKWHRIMGGASMAANLCLIVFIFLPMGNLVMHWWDMGI